MSFNPLDIETYSIADLRRHASVMKIEAAKDWTKEDYIKAINARRKKAAVSRIVNDPDEPIPPGFVRIKLPLTPSGSDSPLDVRVNTFYTSIPRNVLVDVPREIRDTIRNSKEPVTREVLDKDGNRVVRTFEVPSYAFEQHGETPGESGCVKPGCDMREQSLRERYKEIYGRWPKRQSQEWKTFFQKYTEQFADKNAKRAIEEEAA
jgi:hypothetical protein